MEENDREQLVQIRKEEHAKAREEILREMKSVDTESSVRFGSTSE